GAEEWTGPPRPGAETGRNSHLDACREGGRPLAAAQHVREVDVVLARPQRVEFVPAAPPLDLWKPCRDLIGFARADCEEILRDRTQWPRHILQVAANAAEMRERAVCEQRLDRDHVVAHGAITHRATAAGIV